MLFKHELQYRFTISPPPPLPQMKQNKNQICWLFQSCPRARFNFQQFLDEQQFSDTRISFYQQIHGTGFVNSGGHNINEVRLHAQSHCDVTNEAADR